MNPNIHERGRASLRRPHLWLLIVPFIWEVALMPVVNGIEFSPWHIPFPMLWLMMGIVLTSILIAIVFQLDKNAGLEAEEEEFLFNTTAAPSKEAH